MDREMMLEAVDIIRTVADRQKRFRKIIGKFLNKINYFYYKWI